MQEYKEQLGRLQLENETLQSTLRAFDAKSKQDGENSSEESYIWHEEGARIVIENEVQQASLEADVTYKSLSKREEVKLHIGSEHSLHKQAPSTKRAIRCTRRPRIAAWPDLLFEKAHTMQPEERMEMG